MNQISTMLWKEYRNNVHILLFGLIVLLVPVGLLFATFYGNDPEASVTEILAAALIFGGTGGIVFCQFVILCLGGHLIGGERTARTFEFLFNQPVSRLSIVTTKLLFAILAVFAIWGIGGLLIWIGLQLPNPSGNIPSLDAGFPLFQEVAAVGCILFGTSWVASNKVENSVLAMCFGALATGILSVSISYMTAKFGALIEIETYDWTRIVVFFVLGILLTINGVFLFLKRKAP